MLGNNKFVLNQATMKEIVQEWVERNFVRCDCIVTHVEETQNKSFDISLSEKNIIPMEDGKKKAK